MERIKLLKVKYLPKELEEGFLYVSEEFGVAGHLCPCGCKNKIITPIDPTEWSFKEVDNKPTLYPSLGNWQIPCKSHYWITDGVIEWSYQWSKEQIEAGRQLEEEKRILFFNDRMDADKSAEQNIYKRFINWIKAIFKSK